jgi:hypothetical protein
MIKKPSHATVSGHIGFIAHVVLADALTATIVNKYGHPI